MALTIQIGRLLLIPWLLKKRQRKKKNTKSVASTPPESSTGDPKSVTVDNENSVQILPDFFFDKKWYEKAKAAFEIETRLTNIMNGYWTDKEASKLCLKVRADRPYLNAVPEKDLDNIKGIFLEDDWLFNEAIDGLVEGIINGGRSTKPENDSPAGPSPDNHIFDQPPLYRCQFKPCQKVFVHRISWRRHCIKRRRNDYWSIPVNHPKKKGKKNPISALILKNSMTNM
ncbi:uncharacterized protein LOC130669623 [Microplitis mediator]|uniref:uncharacterized protein LOC130669623 n=1 Tax=Microplitis mediator TaxID=375433 RepID=UPI002554FA95|nr:uncharacterized protein LOC130669623 [Microplitis mediator]XP_057328598.1 uncharacterized protein LOC130669623 [Microplitis mediator]